MYDGQEMDGERLKVMPSQPTGGGGGGASLFRCFDENNRNANKEK